jgi:hypothetical protein
LHTFVSGAKSNPKITSKLKGEKLVTLKNVENKNVRSFVNLKRNSNMN